ncbi:MAG: hypothetical protein HY958_14565 [Bacteroidia bacterium]|nr:hypothetical protein [Bacteroidia bacterium]
MNSNIKIKYKHRALYVFIVLLSLNLIWEIFILRPESFIQFLYSLILPLGFAILYFIIKNIKRQITKKYSIRSGFLNSVVFVPGIYGTIIVVLLTSTALISTFIESASSNTVKTNIAKKVQTVTVGINTDTKGDSFESNLYNFIIFSNIFVCNFTQLLIHAEQPDFYYTFHSRNYIHKKESATFKMIMISTLSSMLLQLIAIGISEKFIYRLVRRKRTRKKL